MRKEVSKGKIIVFGIAFWFPLAGVTYQFIHYMLGLRRLGYDPYYVEDSGRWIFDPKLNDLSPDASDTIAAVAPVLESHGFKGRWAFRGKYPGGKCYGMSEREVLDLYRTADAFLNVTGAQEIREEHMTVPRRIYVETDPVAAQIKITQGHAKTLEMLSAHNCHFSFGENFGNPDCTVPLERFQWHATRQPVVLDLWQNPYAENAGKFTTIGTWKHKQKEVVYRGETYHWSKDREFEHFLDLPKRTSVGFELATQVDEATTARLNEYGWDVVDAFDISRDCKRYRDYIQRSRGEFTVAKDQYKRFRSGWFSDRSACYLAASRPVITQDTAFGNVVPIGRGLFSFQTMDDVLAAIDAIEADYLGHCRAAREVAAEYFESSKVLGSLMERAGL